MDNRTLAMNGSTGDLYVCKSGAWTMLNAAGAGSVSNFSSTNLAPLFTTSVATPTTTPALSFSMSLIAPNTLFGNFTTSTGAPSWFTPSGDVSMANGQFAVNRLSFGATSIPLGTPAPASGEYLTFNGTSIVGGTPAGGGGGGSGLLGCTTPTSGNLICDNSMSVTSGTQGILSMGYGTLPPAVTNPLAQLTPDSTGAPFWSPGNSVARARLLVANPITNTFDSTNFNLSRTAPGFGSAMVLRSDYTDCNTTGWDGQTSNPSCADLVANRQTVSTYALAVSDLNRVIRHATGGAVTDTIPAPTGQFAAPFVFWIDAGTADVTVQTSASALINGQNTLHIGASGFAMVWADRDGTNWYAQAYSPPGGVIFIP
jgi:hypothetical protein